MMIISNYAIGLSVSTSIRYFIHSISLTSPPYPSKSYLLLAHVLSVEAERGLLNCLRPLSQWQSKAVYLPPSLSKAYSFPSSALNPETMVPLQLGLTWCSFHSSYTIIDPLSFSFLTKNWSFPPTRCPSLHGT